MSNPRSVKGSQAKAAPSVLGVGMLGFGTVGQGAYQMLQDNLGEITRKVGCPIEVVRIGVRDPAKGRSLPDGVFTTDLESIVDDPRVHVVLELMGGVEPAQALILRALNHGKHVVTANKELIARHGSTLVHLAKSRALDLHYEAAVGGGIPLIQPLKHQLAGNDVIQMMGILNGTTNYILTKMAHENMEFSQALAEAQSHGYAEADPTNDVDGFDTSYKIAILASIAYGRQVPVDGVYREGIRHITKLDLHFADVLGYVVKLLGIAAALDPRRVIVRVHPTFIPKEHPLASVNDAYNALWLHGDFVGDVMFSGKGAGSEPTASAVIGDLIDVGRNMRAGGPGSAIPYDMDMATAPIEELQTAYYVRLIVLDKPKVLGAVALAFGEHRVSLSAMEMRVLDPAAELGEIVFLTHRCQEANFRNALKDIKRLKSVKEVCNWIRVEGAE